MLASKQREDENIPTFTQVLKRYVYQLVWLHFLQRSTIVNQSFPFAGYRIIRHYLIECLENSDDVNDPACCFAGFTLVSQCNKTVKKQSSFTILQDDPELFQQLLNRNGKKHIPKFANYIESNNTLASGNTEFIFECSICLFHLFHKHVLTGTI